jgi:hypothetical protein
MGRLSNYLGISIKLPKITVDANARFTGVTNRSL